MNKQSPIERLSNLSDSDLIALSDGLLYFCPRGVSCQNCPLYDVTPIDSNPDSPTCLAIACDHEYFKRHNTYLH